MLDVFEKALAELSLHGAHVFNRFFDIFKDGLFERKKLLPKFSSFLAYLEVACNLQESY